MSEEITVQPGDTVEIIFGDKKGETGTIIGVYNNSSSIELDKKDAGGKPTKIVLNHSKYKVVT